MKKFILSFLIVLPSAFLSAYLPTSSGLYFDVGIRMGNLIMIMAFLFAVIIFALFLTIPVFISWEKNKKNKSGIIALTLLWMPLSVIVNPVIIIILGMGNKNFEFVIGSIIWISTYIAPLLWALVAKSKNSKSSKEDIGIS